MTPIDQQIANELSVQLVQVSAAIELLNEGELRAIAGL